MRDVVTGNPAAIVALYAGWVAIGSAVIGGLIVAAALVLSMTSPGGGGLAAPGAVFLLPVAVIAAVVGIVAGTKGRRVANDHPESRGFRPSSLGRTFGTVALVVALIGIPVGIYAMSTADEQVEREFDRIEQENKRRGDEFMRQGEQDAARRQREFQEKARQDCIRSFTGKVPNVEEFCR